MSRPETSIAIATFRRVTDNRPQRESRPWRQLAAALTRHTQRAAKDGPLWSPTEYDGNTRGNAQVTRVTCFVLDVEDGTWPDALLPAWEGLAFVAHSTFRHTAEAARWRAVFPLAAPVPAADWPAVYATLVHHLADGHTDPQCKDAARIYYWPACKPHAAPWAWDASAGAWLDPGAYPEPRLPAPATPAPLAAPPALLAPRASLKALVERALKQHGRNNAGFFLACQLRDNAYSQAEAEAVSWEAYVGPTNTAGELEPYLGKDWIRTVRSAYSQPARPPWDPPAGNGAAGPDRRGRWLSVPPEPPAPPVPPVPADGAAEASTPDPELSDLGNAYRLATRHGDDLRYCDAWNTWLLWRGGRWERDRTQEARWLCYETIEALYKAAWHLSDTKRAKAVATFALKSQSRRALDATLSLAQPFPALIVTPEQLDTHPWLLNVANGTIDLRTGRLRPHDRADLLTQRCPVAYDPEARCPTFDRFLLDVMNGDASLADHLRRVIGYTISGSDQERACFALWGPKGRNGKSTLLETMFDILGDYAHKLPRESLMANRNSPGRATPETAGLRGKRFAYLSETQEGCRLDEAMLKELTGRERITARDLYEKNSTFQATHKIWLGTNHKPTVRSTDDAIWDRLRLIPFTRRFGDDGAPLDPQMKEKLLAEAPGILAAFVRGCLDYQRHGLAEPTAVLAATAGYRREMDVIQAFLDDCCEDHRPYLDVKVRLKAVYERFKRWAEENNEYALSQRKLTPRLEEKGFTHAPSTGNYEYWLGLDLRAEEFSPLFAS